MSAGHSYNGWPANSDPAAIGVDKGFDVAGVTFPGGVKGGDVATVLGYVFGRLDAEVEPAVPGWCWGWTYKANVNNPSQLSNHSSATAGDYNAPFHPNGGYYTGWTSTQIDAITAILADVDAVVTWLGSTDPMHFDINCDAARLAEVADRIRGSEPMDLTPANLDDIADAVVHKLMGTAVPEFGDPANGGARVKVSFQNYLPKVGNWSAIAADNTNKLT